MATRMMAAAAALLMTVGLGQAQDGPHQAQIEARQGIMLYYAQALGVLGGMAKGEIPYDAGVARTAADNLAAAANLDISMLWPAGSGKDSGADTAAQPALWADGGLADFDKKHEDLKAAARAMQAAAGADLAALQGAMQGLGAACSGCHKSYRASE